MLNKNKIVIIRYISLFFIALNTLILSRLNTNLSIIILLLIVVNNQFRFFNLNNNKLILLSLLLELILIGLISNLINIVSVFYFVPILLDISFMISKKYKYIFIFFVLLFFMVLNISLDKPILYIIENSSILVLISLMLIYIYEKDILNLKYQNTYDQLRISEDKLRKANSELEIYISSVEELAILKERNRISREIHDSVGHALSATIIQLSAIEKLLKDNAYIYDIVRELKDFVTSSFKEVRDAISELKPIDYENYQNLFKIDELTKNFSKLTGVEVKLTISKNTWVLSDTQSIELYRVIQESLSNSVRHGKASKVDIFITFSPTQLILTIKDNGLGCNIIKKGTGLNSISERLVELNGSVDFNNSSDGFVIQASFPKSIRGDFIE